MHDETSGTGRPLPGRRQVLTAAAAAAGWTLAFRTEARAGDPGTPPSFPPGIRLVRGAFRNWSGELARDAVWTALPASPADLPVLADWARAQRWRLRARGRCHTWSPILAGRDETMDRVVMVDATEHLTSVEVRHGDPASVTAQAGAAMDAVHEALAAAGYGLTCAPATGSMTVAGALAVGGHGTGVPARPGAGHATTSDAVASLTAVVWDAAAGRHLLRTFHRSDPETAALLVHLGRLFVTEATLTVPADVRLRCRSTFDVPAAELFGPPGGRGRTLEQSLRESGRVEAVWLPYTAPAWLKVWTEEPQRPPASREIRSPYPYVFYDRIPEPVSDLARRVTGGAAAVTPLLTEAVSAGIRLGLTATATWDLWGPSRCTLLYLRPDVPRWVFTGWAVLCARADVQHVVHGFWSRLQQGLADHRARGRYPVNGPVEMRITGVDGAGGAAPLLSPACPRPDHPEWDTVVWLNTTAFPGTPGARTFHHDLEQWMLGHFAGRAAVRPEWAKAWAYGPDGPWTERSVLAEAWPASFGTGRRAGGGWDEAVAVLDRHDPARVFCSPFLEALFRPGAE